MPSDSPRRDNMLRAAVALAGVVGALGLLAGGCTTREAPRSAGNNEVNLKTVVMPIEGMSCSACVARIKKALTSLDGVSEVQVNLVERNARIRFVPTKLSPDRLVAAVDALGYRAGPPAEAR